MSVPTTVDFLIDKYGGQILYIYEHALKGYAVSHLPDSVAHALERAPIVDHVSQDRRFKAIQSEGGQYPATWGLDRIDQRSQALNEIYNYGGTGYAEGSGVNVYVLDTGIRTSHYEFSGRAYVAYDAFGGDGQDCNGHGTHVAGTIGGETYGVTKDVDLYSVRVLDCNGEGTTSSIIAGVDWVSFNAIDPAVVNMSIGGPSDPDIDAAVQNAIVNGNLPFVIAAGNLDADACNYSPSGVAEAMTIGATDSGDNRAVALFLEDYWETYGVTSVDPQTIREELYSATTKNIVSNALSANDHLVYKPIGSK